MSGELLERATRALRACTEPADAGEAQLERALARLQRAERARPRALRRWRTAAWTLAATLAGAGAWAHATGKVSWFASVEEPAAAPLAPPPVGRVQARGEAAESSAPEVKVPEPEPLPPVPQLRAPEPPAVKATAPPPRRGPATLEAPAPADPASALYREAHAAHFQRGDYAAALAAWDRYLAAAGPAHRWAVEARFNRGVALFRLGHEAAARLALRPFAEGEYGSYRRDEAGRLLEALRAPPRPAPAPQP